jgi:hypothetical protein
MKGEDIMDLIERYVHDVGWRLPAKQRDDIKKELKSLLMDALEARTGGKDATQEDVAAVLKEFGSPDAVAARYRGDAYVIGPRLYPLYKTVLFIVLCALALGLAVSALVGNAFVPAPEGMALPWSRILQFFGGLISSGWGAIGVVTVIFWGIERGIARESRKSGGKADDWDPKKLPPVPKGKNGWKPSDSIVAAIFIVIGLIIFNGFPSIIAIYNQFDGQWQSVRILSNEALAVYLPLWNIGWTCSLALHMALLARRRFELGTNLAHIAIQLFGIAVAVVMMNGPALLNPQIAEFGFSEEAKMLSSIVPILNAQLRWVFIIIIAACLFEAGRGIYRIVRDGKG